MIKHIDEKVEAFKDFLLLKETAQPLMGCCIGGWEGFGRYVGNASMDLPQGVVCHNDINPALFKDIYNAYSKTLTYDDDLIRCLEPIPSIPWAEAASGCEVEYTGKNFWAKSLKSRIDINPDKSDFIDQLTKRKEDAWLHNYSEILDYLYKNYSNEFPIGQAILRGPLDILAAVMGDENMLYALYDHPDVMSELMKVYTERFIEFLKLHKEHYKPFMGGSVIGQYYIWTPGTCSRLQNDAMSILSPQLFEEFVMESDLAVSGVMEYNLYHIHSTAFHLLHLILKNDRIRIIQISKDEGKEGIEDMIDQLVEIQRHGKCLLLKGRLDNSKDLSLIRERLDYSGLCLQFVVETEQEADEAVSYAKNILER